MSNQKDYVSSSALSLTASSSTFVSKSAGAAANGFDSDSSYLWPAYFVERPDGTYTALIEVDQLPDLIRIRGLPPKLSAVDTAGMTSVGVKKGSQKKYSIDIADISGKFFFSELPKYTAHENASVTPTTTPSSKAPSDAIMLHLQGSPTIAEASSSTTLGPEQEVVIVKPIPRKGDKVYCTYWIARGECHYAQQGCRFKHEMPDLETLRQIMGRHSFPKWWLESIGPQRRIALTNRQQGKRQASAAAPKPHGLTTPNTDTHSNSATESRNAVAQVLVEGLSSVVSHFIPRKRGELDIPSRIAGQSGSNMRSPGGGNIRSSVSGRSGKIDRSPISDTSGSIVRPQISGSSASEICSPVSGPSNDSIRSTISESAVIHDKQLNSNIRAPFSGPDGNSMIHSKRPVSNDRPSTTGLTNDHSPTSGPASTSMTHTTQPVNNDRSPLSGTRSNNMAENTQQSISNDVNLTTYNPPASILPASPLRIEIPQKYIPQFHVAAHPTVSSTSSSAPIRQPRINLPLRQSIWSPAVGNTNGGKGDTKTHGAETEGGRNEGGIPYSKGGSIETTRPYDEIFDLLGPF